MDLKIYPSLLKGEVIVPASKSITHRHLICAALSPGKSRIDNPLICEDTLATISVLKTLGAKFKINKDHIIVKGRKKIKYKKRVITVYESATTLRILLPLLVNLSKEVVINSSPRLLERVMTDDLNSLEGINFNKIGYKLRLSGRLISNEYNLSGKITTQLISGLLIVLPFLNDVTLNIHDIEWTNPYLQLTLSSMNEFGIEYEINNNQLNIIDNTKYSKKDLKVEGDYSNGAVWIAASYLHPTLKVLGLSQSSVQGDQKIFDYFAKLNVDFSYITNGFKYIAGKLGSSTIDITNTPDLGPLLVAICSLGEGVVRIVGTEKLKYKESNRKNAIMEVVNLLGGNVKSDGDVIVVTGKDILTGGKTIDSYNDHRIVMAAAILATVCKEPIVIKNFQAVNKSYPNFFFDFEKLGGKFEVL